MKINFIKSGECYEKVNNIIWFPIKNELKKRNIKYISEYKFKDDCINVIDKLNPTYGEGKDIKNGKCAFISGHGFADKGYIREIIKVNKNYKNSLLDNCDIFMFPINCHKETMIEYGYKNNIHVIGSGKVEYLIKKQKEIKEEDNTIAFVPTHNYGSWGKTSSYPKMIEYLKPLEKNYNILYSPHPYNNEGEPSVESICKAKIVLADCGSTLYEAMVLNKPVIFPSFLVAEHVCNIFQNTLEDRIYKEKIGYHIFKDMDIEKVISDAFKNGVKENQKCFIKEIYPYKTIGNYSKLVVDILETL